jgi:prevent-host-death family protein
MNAISLEEAQAKVAELIENLKADEEIVITRNKEPVARLVGGGRPLRKLGTLQGTVKYMAPDFDAPLDDFGEYSE